MLCLKDGVMPSLEAIRALEKEGSNGDVLSLHVAFPASGSPKAKSGGASTTESLPSG